MVSLFGMYILEESKGHVGKGDKGQLEINGTELVVKRRGQSRVCSQHRLAGKLGILPWAVICAQITSPYISFKAFFSIVTVLLLGEGL